MRLSRLSVRNYRALREVDIPLSQFVCLTGENNAGKSSVLQALSLFITGSSIVSTYYFDPAKPITITLTRTPSGRRAARSDFDPAKPITITLTLTDVMPEDLANLIPEHRERIENLVKNGVLTLVRRYTPDGKSALGYLDMLPKDPRFNVDSINTLLKGKKGKDIREAVATCFPELTERIRDVATQTEAKK